MVSVISGKLVRYIKMFDDQDQSAGSQAVYKKLTSPEVDTPSSEDLADQGVEVIPADRTWGLLPSQLSAVLQDMKIEEQLLKVTDVLSPIS